MHQQAPISSKMWLRNFSAAIFHHANFNTIVLAISVRKKIFLFTRSLYKSCSAMLSVVTPRSRSMHISNVHLFPLILCTQSNLARGVQAI